MKTLMGGFSIMLDDYRLIKAFLFAKIWLKHVLLIMLLSSAKVDILAGREFNIFLWAVPTLSEFFLSISDNRRSLKKS